MNKPVVIQVSRDENGIVYSGDAETPAPQAEKPAAKPIRVRSKKAAEALGWTVVAEPEYVREVPGTNLLEKVPGKFWAELFAPLRPGKHMEVHRQAASSLEALLRGIETFENRRR